MQPRLKGDTFFIPVPDNIHFRNNQGSFEIKGKAIYRWIESLAPCLISQVQTYVVRVLVARA